jgi:ABC-type transport system substrate-binding protein
MIPDGNSAFVALRTHDVDVAALTTPQMRLQARGTQGIRVLRTPENGTEWVSLQTTRGPAADVRVRKAIASALDMAAIRKTFGGDYPQAGSFLPPVMTPWYEPLAPYPHDGARARTLLGGQTIDAVMVIQAESPLWSRIATVVQQELEPAGIRVTVKKYPESLFNAPDGPIRNARFTLAIDGWLGGADPEQSIVFTCAQATVNGDNISRYCDPQFESAFADQAIAPSERQRRLDFARMQRAIHDALPVIPLYYSVWFDGLDAHVHGFARNMLRYPVAPERWDTF